jgi:hypothetical protein
MFGPSFHSLNVCWTFLEEWNLKMVKRLDDKAMFELGGSSIRGGLVAWHWSSVEQQQPAGCEHIMTIKSETNFAVRRCLRLCQVLMQV